MTHKFQSYDMQSYQVHNERIYKDFEFFIKVFLTLGAGVGIVITKPWLAKTRCLIHIPYLGNLTLTLYHLLAAVRLVSMGVLSVSIISHQASKIRRWGDLHMWEWWSW